MNAADMFRLPPIPLAALKGRTKDYILGRASYLRCSPEEVIVELLDGDVARAGMSPKPTQPEALTESASTAAKAA